MFPQSTEEVVAIVKLANETRLPIVGRGAGTGLSGGAIARAGGIIISFARMNRILEIDLANERAVVQPGVVNLDITRSGRGRRLFLRARSFQPARLHHRRQRQRKFRRSAYTRLWRHHQSRARARSRAAGRHGDRDRRGRVRICAGYDLTGLLVGSEGTMALVTKIIVRLMRKPEMVQDDSRDLRSSRRRGRHGGGDYRARHHAGRDRNDGRSAAAHDGGGDARRVSHGRRARSC